jgi:hypothetical protein
MKKGLILITFAWTVEAVGVIAGLVTAMITTYGFELPEPRGSFLLSCPWG